MNNLIKEIISTFVIIVFVSFIMELGNEEKKFIVEPIKFFGTALIMSILGGFIIHQVKMGSKEKREGRSVDD